MKKAEVRPPQDSDTVSRQQLQSWFEITTQLWSRREDIIGGTIKEAKFPVASDNTVSISFREIPTSEEIDRAAAYLLSMKDFASDTRPVYRHLADILEDIVDGVDVAEVPLEQNKTET